MYKVPEVKKCCCCIPLRHGIIIFGYINVICSLLALACMVMMSVLRENVITDNANLDLILTSALFSIFGMSVILNVVLLVAGFQKDIRLLRLYMYYSLATTFFASMITSVLLSRLLYVDAGAAIVAIVMQIYVIILVRSEVVKLEKKELNIVDEPQKIPRDIAVICIPENATLLSYYYEY